MVYKKLLAAWLFFLISCHNSSSPDYDASLPALKVNNIPAPAPNYVQSYNVYPHDSNAYTQGLEYYDGKLYEGTGEWGRSNLRIVDIKTGKVENNYLIPDKSIFGEGITIFKNKIYQLTWKSHHVFVYNLKDFSHPIDTLTWGREGWGATNDGKEYHYQRRFIPFIFCPAG